MHAYGRSCGLVICVPALVGVDDGSRRATRPEGMVAGERCMERAYLSRPVTQGALRWGNNALSYCRERQVAITNMSHRVGCDMVPQRA